MSSKQPQKKQEKIVPLWFCSKCLQIIKMEIAFQRDLFPHQGDPIQIQKALKDIGFDLICNKCGNKEFIKKEFTIPIEQLVQDYFAKEVKKFIKEKKNPNPSVRDEEHEKA